MFGFVRWKSWSFLSNNPVFPTRFSPSYRTNDLDTRRTQTSAGVCRN